MRGLEHGNLVPFYGVSTTVADFCLVSPWYKNGTIVEYVKKNPDVNRFDLASPFAQPRRPDTYPHPHTAVGCGKRTVFCTRERCGWRLLETGT